MQRASTILLVAALVLTACGEPDTTLPVLSHDTEASQSAVASAQRVVVAPKEFPSSIAVSEDVLRALLASSFSALDPTVRAFHTRAREPFRITLTDGTHLFSSRLKSMGLVRADIRRDLVAVGEVRGDATPDIVAVIEYVGDGTLLASEVLIFSIESGTVQHSTSYVLGEVDVEQIGIANSSIRVRAQGRTGTVNMTLAQE